MEEHRVMMVLKEPMELLVLKEIQDHKVLRVLKVVQDQQVQVLKEPMVLKVL
tara:strand:- start:228 stop:383 length:156 start_codon:yes stop_codon:yes gene_type:complete